MYTMDFIIQFGFKIGLLGFIWKWFSNHEDTLGENHLGFKSQNKPVEGELKLQYSVGHSLD